MSEQLPESQKDQQQLIGEVEAAIRTADLPHATALAREALDRGSVHPLLLHLRGHWFADQGRYDDALHDLERARELSPTEPRIPNGIGECLLNAERYADAIDAFNAALRLWPEFPLAHRNRGFALESLGEHKLAEQAYKQASALDPDYADPLARLAGLAAARNDWAATGALAQRALTIDPSNAAAHFALAKTEMAARDFAGAAARLQSAIDDPQNDALERANASKLLGDALDGQNRTKEAFAAYRSGNEQFRAFFEPRLRAANTESTPVLAGRVSAYMEGTEFSAAAAGNSAHLDGASGLVFLLGFPRSGTTLLGQVLGAHSDVVTLEERFPIVEADRELLRKPGGLERLTHATEEELQHYRRSYWKYVHGFGVHVRDKVIVDKLPMHTFRLPLIARLFPEAKILFALRDPRDVVLSAFRRIFMIHAFTYELLQLESAARLYDTMMRLRELARPKLALDWLDVRNEDMIADFEGETRKVCAFLNIPWQNSLRRFSESAIRQNIATPSSAQVRSGLSGAGIGYWRRYKEQLAPVLPVLEPWVETFGYPAA
jgi:tetratricopeptide (TPR) repeat protein